MAKTAVICSTGKLAAQLVKRAAFYGNFSRELRGRWAEFQELYKTVVNQVVYLEHPPGAPDGPQVYRRTYKLLESVKTTLIQDRRGAGIRIFFDEAISRSWDGRGSYSIYVPLSTGFLASTRHWTSDWRERAYNAVLEMLMTLFKTAGGAHAA